MLFAALLFAKALCCHALALLVAITRYAIMLYAILCCRLFVTLQRYDASDADDTPCFFISRQRCHCATL